MDLTYFILLVDWAHVLILSFRYIFRHILPRLPASVAHLVDSFVYIKSYRVRPLSFSATFHPSHLIQPSPTYIIRRSIGDDCTIFSIQYIISLFAIDKANEIRENDAQGYLSAELAHRNGE